MADEQPKTPKAPAPEATPAPPPGQPASARPADKQEDKASDSSGAKPEDGAEASPSSAGSDRDTAVRSLPGEAAALSQTQMREYVTRGISQLNAETINFFTGAYDDDPADGSGGRRTGRRAGKVRFTEHDLEQATASFVEPPGFRDELDVIADRNLVVLAGPARTGKRTRALQILRRTLQDADLDQVVEELPVSVLASPMWRVPREGSGYLVSDVSGRDDTFTATKVGEEWLRTTSHRLLEVNSFLVVVTGPVSGSLADAPNRAEFVLDEWELPDPLTILQRRLRDTLPSEADDLIGQLDDTELAEVLIERDSPAFAVRAATEIIEGHRAGRDLVETVVKLGSAEGLVREWLSRGPEVKDLSLVLATAVLDSAGYLKVADAAVSLYRRLNRAGASLSLRYTQRLMVEHTWIHLVPSANGRQAPTVRFRHPRMRPEVLAAVWCDYDGARASVLDWLEELAVHPDVEIRAGAAQAIGILAQLDFQHSVHTYLQPWGRNNSALLRQTAAQGLNVAGVLGNDRTAWSLLEEWAEVAHHENTENLCTTAALAAGGDLGIRDPRRALKVLRDFVTGQDNWQVLTSVAVSAGSLLGAGRGDDVLAALCEWTQLNDDKDVLIKALVVFTWVVHPEADESWPLLLRTADGNRKHLSRLWSRALGNRVVQPIALDELRTWVRRVDADAGAHDVVLGLLADISDESPADRFRLLHALSQWAQDRYQPSFAAATFYDLIHEPEDEVP